MGSHQHGSLIPSATNLYPIPRTVCTIRGFSGSVSTFMRSRCTCTLTNLVSPPLSYPQTRFSKFARLRLHRVSRQHVQQFKLRLRQLQIHTIFGGGMLSPIHYERAALQSFSQVALILACRRVYLGHAQPSLILAISSTTSNGLDT